jgi:6-phosphogluconolactonase
MPAEASDLALAATRYAAALPALPFDLVLLGVGPDGHVCSLFPGLLPVGAALVAAIEGAPKPPARRLTLTLAALAGARLLVVAAFGALKAPVVHAALRDPDSSLPVARAARAAQRTLFLLDPDAARLL